MGAGLLKPKNTILGADIAGWIEAVGRNVKHFQPGDEVFGDISDCGLGAGCPTSLIFLSPAIREPSSVTAV